MTSDVNATFKRQLQKIELALRTYLYYLLTKKCSKARKTHHALMWKAPYQYISPANKSYLDFDGVKYLFFLCMLNLTPNPTIIHFSLRLPMNQLRTNFYLLIIFWKRGCTKCLLLDINLRLALCAFNSSNYKQNDTFRCKESQ